MSLSELAHQNTPDVLMAYNTFNPEDLASQLQGLVATNVDELAARGLRGVIRRYSGSHDDAVQSVEKAQHNEDGLLCFAIVDSSGDVQGSGTIYPSLPLRKQRLPLPPALLPDSLVVNYPYANMNIHAWSGNKDKSLLSDAYRQLDIHAVGYYAQRAHRKTWTLEPVRSPQYIHDALADSGMKKVATRRFDDGESRSHIPPRSALYARLSSEWLTAYGQQKELRTNKKSFITELDEQDLYPYVK